MNRTYTTRSVPLPNRRTGSTAKWNIILGALGLILVIDQMLLPMFHPFGIPFKPSYAILLVFPLFVIRTPVVLYTSGMRRRFWYLAAPVLWIAFWSVVGQFYLLAVEGIFDLSAIVTPIVTYVLMVLAIVLGQHVPQFKMQWLLWILYSSILLVLALALAADRVPWLAQLWWKSEESIAYQLAANEIRPTPFGDGSMVGTALLFLFVVVAVRARYITLEKYHVVLATMLVILTATVLVSRNQIVAVSIMAIALMFGGSGSMRRKLLFLVVLALVVLVITIFYGDVIRNEYPAVDRAIERLENQDYLDFESDRQSETILRPLLNWERFWGRYLVSPIWGTGFSLGEVEPFARLNFHNDWFHIWATSGMLGGIALFVWMYRIYRELGLLILLPFFLPGLTNSFLLHVAGVIFYCFMLGVLVERKHLPRTTGNPPPELVGGQGMNRRYSLRSAR